MTSSSGVYSIPIGGDATGLFSSNSGQALTANFNPLFAIGSGSPINEPSGSPATSSSPVSAPQLISPYPAGPGYSTLNTALPTSALGLSSSSLSSSGLMLLLLIGAAALLLLPAGGRR